jgi:parallel beta-helix repeat protein
VLDCGCGIWLYGASQNSVTDNYIARNDYGLRIETSTNNNIARNTITDNWGGVWLVSASNNKLRSNSMTNNVRNFGTASDQPARDINDVDTSNTVDGKPIYYWIGISDRAIPADAGCVILVNCIGVKVQGLNLAKNQGGILLVSSQNSAVMNNYIAESGEGIGIYNSFNDSIVGNNINGNVGIHAGGNGTRITNNIVKADSTGITVNGCYQTITDNTVEAGTFGSGNKIIDLKGSYNTIMRNRLVGQTYVGIVLEGSYNSFYENIIVKGEQMRASGDWNIIAKNTFTDSGITVSSGSNNIVCANTIVNGLGLGIGGQNNLYYANHVENNYYVGAEVIGTEAHSFNNRVYHNNFINNTQQVKNWGANPTNFWDNGSEGNYWSDYNGTDANGDGIGDTPYFVKSETFDENLGSVVDAVHGQDNYPLMSPFDVSSVTIELPEWESPSPFPSPSPSPEPTPSPSPSPTPPSPEPTSTPETQQQEPVPISLVAAASAVFVAVVGLGLMVFFKKRNH